MGFCANHYLSQIEVSLMRTEKHIHVFYNGKSLGVSLIIVVSYLLGCMTYPATVSLPDNGANYEFHFVAQS